MRITIQPYRAYDINKLTEKAYSATIFADPKIVERIEEDGSEIVEHEVTVLHSGVLPVSSLADAEEYMGIHYDAIIATLKIEQEYQERLRRKEEAEQYLSATDYRTLKAVREIPEIAAKLEEMYPGELDRNRSAVKNARS